MHTLTAANIRHERMGMLVPVPGRMPGAAMRFGQLGPIASVAGFSLAFGALKSEVHSAIWPGSTPRRLGWAMGDAKGMQPITPISRAAPQ